MVVYWLDLFTGTTWKEFREAGAKISGFRERRRKTVNQIAPGDILLCYITGVMRWVGALEVIGPSDNQEKIWAGQTDNDELEFPARLQVTPLIMLDPEYGVPMEELEGNVAFYKDASYRGGFKGFLRGSPTKFDDEDGKFVYFLKPPRA
jgi:hypothetical protein